MTDAKYLKKLIDPHDLASMTLGKPEKVTGSSWWYKSPFRAVERTASFEVSNTGFYDFGTSKHYDIFSFVQRLRNCSFKEAVQILSSMFGIATNEYESKKMREFMEQQRLAMKIYREKIDTWFLQLMNTVEQEWDENEECIRLMTKYKDTLDILYRRQVFLGCLREDILSVSTFEDKEKLRKEIKREGLPKWMRNLEESI